MIKINEYIENRDLLEMYYTPYQEKCAIVDAMLDEMTNKTFNYWSIDYAQLEGIKNTLFVNTITNLDMFSKDEDDLMGYDLLCSLREWDSLIVRIQDEYDAFNKVLDLKIKTLRERHSVSRVIDEAVSKIAPGELND